MRETHAARLIAASRRLAKDAETLRFAAPVAHVYNPLVYARAPHEDYLRRYAQVPCEVLLVGMNPGPWGMAQTGVPFGEVSVVRDWLGVRGAVRAPAHGHPRRPVLGFDCRRSEISGARLWGWARDVFETPRRFFQRFFVTNYCPLAFLEASGRNRTPDKLPAAERAPLFRACDAALRAAVECLRPRLVVGVGGFAEARARAALTDLGVCIVRILHPSPASPLANRDWTGSVTRQLRAAGVALPGRAARAAPIETA